MAQAPREQWATRTGFILAAIGSAVGLGNMWRFSYLTAENGGAAFVVLYLAMTAFIGLPVMLAELTVIEALADRQFLPSYGFPIGLQKLRVIAPDDRDRNRFREEDQFRLERSGIMAVFG